jgi:hypothetical protein
MLPRGLGQRRTYRGGDHQGLQDVGTTDIVIYGGFAGILMVVMPLTTLRLARFFVPEEPLTPYV